MRDEVEREIKEIANTTMGQNYFFASSGVSSLIDNTNEQDVFFWRLEEKKSRNFSEKEIEYFEKIVEKYITFLEFMKKNKE